MLGNVDFRETVVIADLEAGIGTLTRLDNKGVDLVLVVVERSAKSLEVGMRAAELAKEKATGRVVVVANRIRDDDDLTAVRATFPDHEVVPVPDDPAIVEADRKGVAPLDLAPDAPAVRALVDLASSLLPVSA